MTVFKALSITERKQKTPLTLLDFKEPELAKGEFLIENVAVAQNPIDWKQLDNDTGIPTLPWTNGGDAAGIVYKVGPGVTEFNVGDRVISFLSRKTARHSAYQTHSIGQLDRTVKLPQSYTFEEGSTVPLAYTTAGAGLAVALKVTFPLLDETIPAKARNEPLLVWGGSSSVGAYVIQLASFAGYKVIATASSANHEYVKSLGAAHVFDYHESDVIENVREVAGSNLSLAYDSISSDSTAAQCVQSITSSSGGTVAAIRLIDPSVSTPLVKVLQTGAIEAFKNPEVGKNVFSILEQLLDRKLLIPNPVKVIPGGLNGVFEGFELGRSGKVSAEKLVYRIADTKF